MSLDEAYVSQMQVKIYMVSKCGGKGTHFFLFWLANDSMCLLFEIQKQNEIKLKCQLIFFFLALLPHAHSGGWISAVKDLMHSATKLTRINRV